MVVNPYSKYQENSIATATGPELTLMLYNGGIKFCNIAIEGIKENNVQKAHEHIVKAQNVIDELRSTLNRKYDIANEMDEMYVYINKLLLEGNYQKDENKIQDACLLIRNYRDAWQVAMKAAK